MMRTFLVLVIGMILACDNAFATSFEFAGLSSATTPQDVAKRYPNSTTTGSYVYVSPKDTHDHIFGIELFGNNLSYRFRINFESPDHKNPSCEVIEKSILLKYGNPTKVRNFREEAMKNRYLLWKLDNETVTLQCFMGKNSSGYLAEAIVVNPTEPKVAPSNE